jgi:hypothetical protein
MRQRGGSSGAGSTTAVIACVLLCRVETLDLLVARAFTSIMHVLVLLVVQVASWDVAPLVL